jgi:hypothetical protein
MPSSEDKLLEIFGRALAAGLKPRGPKRAAALLQRPAKLKVGASRGNVALHLEHEADDMTVGSREVRRGDRHPSLPAVYRLL